MSGPWEQKNRCFVFVALFWNLRTHAQNNLSIKQYFSNVCWTYELSLQPTLVKFWKKKKSSSKPFLHALLSVYRGEAALTGGQHVSGSQQVTDMTHGLLNKWIIRVHEILIELCHEITSPWISTVRIYNRRVQMNDTTFFYTNYT